MAVFVICSKYPKCDGPGVAEYADDYTEFKPVEDHACGFCSKSNAAKDRVPMRAATEKEVEKYLKDQEDRANG